MIINLSKLMHVSIADKFLNRENLQRVQQKVMSGRKVSKIGLAVKPDITVPLMPETSQGSFFCRIIDTNLAKAV